MKFYTEYMGFGSERNNSKSPFKIKDNRKII